MATGKLGQWLGNPRVTVVSEGLEYKTAEYANFADWQTALATEVAAGWEPFLSTSRKPDVGSATIIVTYRRPL